MNRQANGAGLAGDGSRHALANPPEGVGGKFVPAGGVELFNGPFKTEGALLNEVEKFKPLALIFFRHTDNKAKIRLHHSLLGAATDPKNPALLAIKLSVVEGAGPVLSQEHHRLHLIAQLNLLSRGQQRDASDGGQVPTHGVAAAAPLGVDGFRC